MFEITYPEEDGVLFLKYGDELVSAGNFGLVQWPESTQNLDVAFRVRISHCAGTKQWPAGSKGIKRDFHRKEEKKKKERKRTKYSSPERWMGASATAPASKQRLAGGAFGRNLGNYRLLGESPAKFIKGMWIEEGWGGRICCFEVSSSWGGWLKSVGGWRNRWRVACGERTPHWSGRRCLDGAAGSSAARRASLSSLCSLTGGDRKSVV